MGDLFNKMTLYDIISTAIPGTITLLAFMTTVPKEVIKIKNGINNDLILFGIFIVAAYCIGWILSELMRMFLKVISKIGKGKSDIIIFPALFVLCLYFSFFHLNLFGLRLFLFTMTHIVFFILLFVIDMYKLSKKQKEQDDEYMILVKKCQKLLIKDYGDNFNNIPEDELIKKIETMSHSAYFLVQTDSKYGRVHNYNSSKFFSRNLSGSILCIIGVIYYWRYQDHSAFQLWDRYSLAIFLCTISFYALYRKYRGFAQKVKILVITYYIDFLENKEGKKS